MTDQAKVPGDALPTEPIDPPVDIEPEPESPEDDGTTTTEETEP